MHMFIKPEMRTIYSFFAQRPAKSVLVCGTLHEAYKTGFENPTKKPKWARNTKEYAAWAAGSDKANNLF